MSGAELERVVLITGAGSSIGAALARHITGQVIHVDGGLTPG
ncbi:hypothetical protein [Paraburkholderia sp. SIMBA_030]